MKYKSIALLTSSLIVGMSMVSAVNAAGSHTAGQDQGSGRIHFQGTVISAPCSIEFNDGDEQLVLMNNVSAKSLENQGISSGKQFNIKLKDCDLVKDQQQGKAASQFTNVSMTFSGTPNPLDRELLAINGTASGFGILVQDSAGKNIDLGDQGNPGAATTPVQLNGTTAVIPLQAFLKGLPPTGEASSASPTVVPGDFNAIIDFSLHYE